MAVNSPVGRILLLDFYWAASSTGMHTRPREQHAVGFVRSDSRRPIWFMAVERRAPIRRCPIMKFILPSLHFEMRYLRQAWRCTEQTLRRSVGTGKADTRGLMQSRQVWIWAQCLASGFSLTACQWFVRQAFGSHGSGSGDSTSEVQSLLLKESFS